MVRIAKGILHIADFKNGTGVSVVELRSDIVLRFPAPEPPSDFHPAFHGDGVSNGCSDVLLI